jgi:hypothetical protein
MPPCRRETPNDVALPRRQTSCARGRRRSAVVGHRASVEPPPPMWQPCRKSWRAAVTTGTCVGRRRLLASAAAARENRGSRGRRSLASRDEPHDVVEASTMEKRTHSPAWSVPRCEAGPAEAGRCGPARRSARFRSTLKARTRDQAPVRGRRVSVTDPIAAARRHDYADAFELRLEGPDRCSPEEWLRAGVNATPAWIKRIAGNADGLGSVHVVLTTTNPATTVDASSSRRSGLDERPSPAGSWPPSVFERSILGHQRSCLRASAGTEAPVNVAMCNAD